MGLGELREQLHRVAREQGDPGRHLGIADPLVCLAEEAHQIRVPLDREDLVTQGGDHPGIPAEAGGGVDHGPPAASTKQANEWMPCDRYSVQTGTDTTPGPVPRRPQFEAVRARLEGYRG